MTFTPPALFIADKQQTATDPSRLPVAFKQLERYIASLRIPAGITSIGSADGTVTVTNPTGPHVDLHSTTSSGGGYLSLTGPGQTATPGDLTQAGGFTVNDPGGSGISLTSASGAISIQASSSSAVLSGTTTTVNSSSHTVVESTGPAGVVTMQATHYVGIVQPGPGTFTSGIELNTSGPLNVIAGGTLQLGSNSNVVIGGPSGVNLLFFNSVLGSFPVPRQSVTGSRGGNAALTSLLTALGIHGYNLIDDSSTP